MSDSPVLELALGDRLRLRKPHPCGSHAWEVVRLGADIGLRCDGCGHRVLLERREVERQLSGPVEHAALADDMATNPDGGAGS